MKTAKKNSKQLLPLLKRSSTPCITQRKNSLSKAKSSKCKKIHTEPLPSPNNSFTEEIMKQIRKSLIFQKNSRNSSPVSKLKLSFYLKIEAKLWDLIQRVPDGEAFARIKEEYWELIKTSRI